LQAALLRAKLKAVTWELCLTDRNSTSPHLRLVTPITPLRSGAGPSQAPPQTTAFDRRELNQILNLYGRKVASGEWRDYAMNFDREKAVFAVYRRASECPLYIIEKAPRLARKQGAYSVLASSGHILKRGHDLARVLDVLDR
jgi:Protein of unknown function (DUF2794)